ncbi:hypothetical protein PoB_006251000 [Plakobranchus ocellatus]|uniref:Uncharacterized protein n=1 Tax=Plakobranchus ocellatus TaxID=259542 RepID=A0AAV4CW22_9GAST|nr:hypothetical protein PoB_006251000 [Plakobranchus ocellatus]
MAEPVGVDAYKVIVWVMRIARFLPDGYVETIIEERHLADEDDEVGVSDADKDDVSSAGEEAASVLNGPELEMEEENASDSLDNGTLTATPATATWTTKDGTV